MEKMGGNQSHHSPDEVRNAVLKDLWWRDRKLRDHNMYMGPMAAFEDIIPRGSSK